MKYSDCRWCNRVKTIILGTPWWWEFWDVAELLCWWLLKWNTSISNRSTTSKTCHSHKQHHPSPTWIQPLNGTLYDLAYFTGNFNPFTMTVGLSDITQIKSAMRIQNPVFIFDVCSRNNEIGFYIDSEINIMTVYLIPQYNCHLYFLSFLFNLGLSVMVQWNYKFEKWTITLMYIIYTVYWCKIMERTSIKYVHFQTNGEKGLRAISRQN